MRQVSDNTLQQVQKFKLLVVVFTSDWRSSEEIGTWIGKANAVLDELYRSVVTKQGGHSVSILRKWSGHPRQFSWNFTQIVITPYDKHLQNLNEICKEMAWL